MIPVLEFEKRALEGPVMKMDEFDLALAKTVRKLVKKYELKYNPKSSLWMTKRQTGYSISSV